MNNTNSTLLAFLIALSNSHKSLTEEECTTLNRVAGQLHSPKYWESDTKPLLEKMIRHNLQLNQSYQRALSQIEALTYNELINYLPTSCELKKAFPSNTALQERGMTPNDESDDFKSYEIRNMVISVLSEKDPQTVLKTSNSIVEKLKKFLNIKD